MIISHESAIEFWQKTGLRIGDQACVLPATPELCAHTGCSDALLQADELGLSAPLHLLKLDANSLGARAMTKLHLERGCDHHPCVFLLKPGIAVTTPELAFMQTASRRTDAQNLMLAYELCGSYGELPPLMSPERLGRMLSARTLKAGCGPTRRILPFILAESKSAAESLLSLHLILPRSMDGFAFKKPLLNHPVRLNATHRRVFHVDSLRPDLLWEEDRLAVEYDSRERHSDYEARERDALRSNAFQDMGYDYLCITKSQLEDAGLFFAQVQTIARKLGHTAPDPLDMDQLAAFYRIRMELSPDWLGACDELTRRIDFPQGVPKGHPRRR
ncbi:MAG: hypothetical protein IJH83_08920 [Coriobacteriales bacterium]|nr:hypothetical protein [Coriobacteriales bacterium]